MNGENTKRPMNASTVIVWQVLGFFCSVLGCSMGTGLELVFCALAAAFCGCLWQVQRSVLAGLGTLAGGLCGVCISFWLWGPTHLLTFTGPLWADPVEIPLDLRLIAPVHLVLILALAALLAGTGKEKQSRAVLVARATALVALSQLVCLFFIFFQKYQGFSVELLKEKLSLAVFYADRLLTLSLPTGVADPAVSQVVAQAARSLVYSLPTLLVLAWGACGFLMSFLAKRLRKRAGLLGEDLWIFRPGSVSAVAYLALSFAGFVGAWMDPDGSVVFGLQILSILLGGAFFVMGLSAWRYLRDKRRQAGLGGRGNAWPWLMLLVIFFSVLLPLLIRLVTLVGVIFVLADDRRRRQSQNGKNP